MSFRIWAHGLRGFNERGRTRTAFHYSKSNCLDRGDFDPPTIFAMLPSTPNATGIVTKIVGTPSSHIGAATVNGAFRIAELEFTHLVMQGINLLAINSHGGNVSLYCHQTKWYWADSNSFVNYHMVGGNPGRDFLRKILPELKKTNLSNFGVLAEIAGVLSAYNSALPHNARPNLRIEIRH